MTAKSRRGSVTVLVLSILAISTVLMAAIVQLVVVAKDQVTISRDLVRYRSVLDSLIDYTIHGIKQRWCFSATMWSDPCTWFHTGSTERLIMSDNAVRAIGEAVASNPALPAAPPFRLTNIDITVPIAMITSVHPLFRAIQPAQSAVFNTVRFEIWRINNVNYPTRGDEALLRIRVTLNSAQPLFKGLTDLSATSTVMVFPRQLNQFAAIIPRDLRMDLGTPVSADGDMNIATFGARSAAGTGIFFESPVFVNRDVRILAQSAAADPPYSPATFAQRVVLGTGRVFQGGALMTPATPGGQGSRFYDEVSGIGGFLGGVEIDDSTDQGLETFYGAQTIAPPNPALMEECVEYIANKTDLTRSKDSPLYFQQVAPFGTGLDVGYKLALSGNNAFNPQAPPAAARILSRSFPTVVGDPTTGGWNAPPTISNPGTPAIAYVMISFGMPPATHWIQARMAWDSVIQATFWDMSFPPPRKNPTVRFELRPVIRFGIPQPNEAEFHAMVDPGTDHAWIPSPIRIYLKAFDNGTHMSADRRKNDPTIATLNPASLREANIQLNVIPGLGFQPAVFSAPLDPSESHHLSLYGTCVGGGPPLALPPTAPNYTRASACSGPGVLQVPPYPKFSDRPPDPATNYGDIEERCAEFRSTRGTAIGMADWGASFVANTRRSWHFRPMGEADPVFNFPGTVGPVPAYNGPELVFTNLTDNEVVVRSIVTRCRIAATANRVNALLACDELVIDNRGTPLEINGTIIAGRTNIAPGALSAGIRWRSLRHPQALYSLRQAPPAPLVQHDFVTACPNTLALPEFSPGGSIVDMSTQRTCNPLRITEAADPFSWTTVDPDCGFAAGESFISCKRRPLRFVVREINRVSDL